MKKNLFVLDLLFFISLFLSSLTSNIFAENISLKSRVEKIGISDAKLKRKLANKTLERKKLRQRELSSIKRGQKIKRPDLIISIDLEKVRNQEVDLLTDELIRLKSKSKNIEYYDAERLESFFLYLYDSRQELTALKKKFKFIDSIKVSPNRKYQLQYSPNDPYYSQQWNLTNIKYSKAMDIGTGSNNVVIAVLDNGVNVDDTDLTNNVWENPGEIYDNLIDDDGNGYIDDKYGCNMYEKWWLGFNYIPCLKDDIRDDVYGISYKHGSYLASIAASVTNNSYGIASVCPSCKIMVLKVTDDYNQVYLDTIPFALDYAVANEADIINYSLGSTCPFDSTSETLATAIDTVINTHNISFVQAAGNYGSDEEMSQSYCVNLCGSDNSYCYTDARHQAYYYVDGKDVDNKINVASINSSSQRSSFSVYDGSNQVLTIAAPGENIPVSGLSSFEDRDGTSYSAPHVSGAIGLMLTRILSYRTPTQAEIRNWLVDYGDVINTDKNIGGKKLNLHTLNTIPEVQEKVRGTNYVYISRFYAPSSSSHFWTADPNEVQHLRDNEYSTKRYDGISFYAYSLRASDTIPVFRLYNQSTGRHLFTPNHNERNSLLNNQSGVWRDEGVAWYAYPDNYTGSAISVYRFYNCDTGNHFYTPNTSEKDSLQNRSDNLWKYDGVSYYAFASQTEGTSPVYRFYNLNTGHHFFTASESEKNHLEINQNDIWRYEGKAFYVFLSRVGNTIPVFRLYNQTTGHHLFTPNHSERNALLNDQSSMWRDEGIAWYAYSSQVEGTSAVYRLYNRSIGYHFFTINSSEKDSLQNHPDNLWRYEGVAWKVPNL